MDMGIFGLFTSILAISNVVATGQMQFSLLKSGIGNAEYNEYFNWILQGSFIVAIVIGLVLLLYSLIFKGNTFNFYLFVPFGILINTVLILFNNICIARGKFHLIAKYKIAASILPAVISIILSIFLKGPIGLILGFLLGLFICVILFQMGLRDIITSFKLVSFKSLLSKYRENINFVKYTTISEIVNNLVGQIPIFILSAFSSLESVGLYKVASKFLNLPVEALSANFSTILKSKIGNPTEETKRLYVSTLKILLVSGLLIYFMECFIFRNFNIDLLLGSNWKGIEIYIYVLGLLYLGKFIVSPFMVVFQVYNFQRIALIGSVLLLVSMVLAGGISWILEVPSICIVLFFVIIHSIFSAYYAIKAYQIFYSSIREL